MHPNAFHRNAFQHTMSSIRMHRPLQASSIIHSTAWTTALDVVHSSSRPLASEQAHRRSGCTTLSRVLLSHSCNSRHGPRRPRRERWTRRTWRRPRGKHSTQVHSTLTSETSLTTDEHALEPPDRGHLRGVPVMAHQWKVDDVCLVVSARCCVSGAVLLHQSLRSSAEQSSWFNLCQSHTDDSLAIVAISVGYASLMAYIRRSDRRLALKLSEELAPSLGHDASVEQQRLPTIAV